MQGFATDRMIFRDDELSYALGRGFVYKSVVDTLWTS